MIEKFQSLIGANESGATSLQFRNGSLPIFGIQGFDRVLNHRDPAAALKQAPGGEVDAEFGDHTKDDKLSPGIEALQQFISMEAGKDVERLLFEENLLVLRKIRRQLRCGLVGDRGYFASQGLGNKPRSGSAFDAMRRKGGELGVVLDVIAAVRNQKDAVLAGGIGEPFDVGQQAFGARHIEIAAGQHEILLRVHFPENNIGRYHTGSTWSVILKQAYNILSPREVRSMADVNSKTDPVRAKVQSRLVIRNIGLLLSGDLRNPISDADTVVAVDGKITAVGKQKDVDTEARPW